MSLERAARQRLQLRLIAQIEYSVEMAKENRDLIHSIMHVINTTEDSYTKEYLEQVVLEYTAEH